MYLLHKSYAGISWKTVFRNSFKRDICCVIIWKEVPTQQVMYAVSNPPTQQILASLLPTASGVRYQHRVRFSKCHMLNKAKRKKSYSNFFQKTSSPFRWIIFNKINLCKKCTSKRILYQKWIKVCSLYSSVNALQKHNGLTWRTEKMTSNWVSIRIVFFITTDAMQLSTIKVNLKRNNNATKKYHAILKFITKSPNACCLETFMWD